MTATGRSVALIIVLILVGAAGLFAIRTQTTAERLDVAPASTTEPRPDPNVLDPSIGVEPTDPPVFAVEADFAMVGDKPLLTFSVTERHGWAADAITVEYWHIVRDDEGAWYQLDDPQRFFCRGVLPLGGVLTDSTPVHYTEFTQLDDYGTSENWRARVQQWGKVLAPRDD
jgi:hypothetical protein